MSAGRAKGILIAVVAWVVIIAILAIAYRFIFRPAREAKLTDETGSASRYEHELVVAADSFSGYALLRCPELAGDLAGGGIKLVIDDDGADYGARIEALRDGDVQLAAFTVDSFISAGAAIGDFPATIVMILDESKGADAIVTYDSGVAQVHDLDHPDARFVLTPGSPSEFLARVTIADFGLQDLSNDWIVAADGAADVFARFCEADKNQRRAYVLWEPFVLQALEKPGARVLLDSSNLKGYVFDVLVAERDFLHNHEDLVRTFVEAYLRAGYAHRGDERMTDLVVADAKLTGSPRLKTQQARKLVDGIQWKNTLENYAHFGLLPDDDQQGLAHIEDVISNISKVLVQTGALGADPINARASTLFFDRILRDLQAADFHPGKRLGVMSGVGPGTSDLDAVRGDVELPALTDEQWERLMPVGELRTRPISFARGTARINIQSQRELADLAQRLKAWPQYYLTVIGQARAGDNPEADRRLAEQRAEAVVAFLGEAGLDNNRMRRKATTLTGRGGAAQSVSFVVGQPPY